MSEALNEGEAMMEPVIDPMIPFIYMGVSYEVHMDACSRGVIKLPTDEYVAVSNYLKNNPPQIIEVREAFEDDGDGVVFEAVTAPWQRSCFMHGGRRYEMMVPEEAAYFDGSLAKLPDGTLVVWGSVYESMIPPMEDIVPADDPRVGQAGGRIYPATLIA